MIGFIFLFVKSLLYTISTLNAKTPAVIPSNNWTWSREANTIELYLKNSMLIRMQRSINKDFDEI